MLVLVLGTFRTPRTDTKRMLIRHLGSRIRQSPCGELVFTNGNLFIRGTLRIRQVHIYLDVLQGTHFCLDSMIHARVRVKTRTPSYRRPRPYS